MFRRHLFSAIIALLALTAPLFGQKVKSAKTDMDKLSFLSAIQTLQNILEKEDNSEAKILLAECYRLINDTENAEYWFGQVVRLPEAQPIHKLQYGRMLQINGKCDLAKEWYDQFAKEVPDDVRGQYLVKACDYEDELMTKNAGIYELASVPFNSNLDDYTPAITKDAVIFASDRDKGSAIKRQHMWTGNPFAELYEVSAKKNGKDDDGLVEYTYGRPDKYSKSLNTKFHEASVSYSPDGKTIFFTRNNYLNGKTGKSDDGIIKLKIFYGAAKGDDSWSNLESLPFNSDEYSVAHPSVSADGSKLYFASDMPGGFGAMDLYVSEQENGRWGPPINLGPNVNTEGNEIFPFIDAKNRLYFASDGHIGLGGLDIFYSTEKGESEWNVPVNLGYPINTTHDDFSVVFNEKGTFGYFSSDRDGGVGRDDIYSFKKIATPVEIFVFDAGTKEPIKDALVTSSMTGLTLKTGSDGKAILDMKLNECADFVAKKELYKDATKQGCTKGISLGDVVVVEIPMQKSVKAEVEGIVFDASTGLPLAGATVSLINECGSATKVEPIVTDASGRYKFPLELECCYKMRAEKEGFIAAAVNNTCTKGLNEDKVFAANITLQRYLSDGSQPSGPTVGGDKKPENPANIAPVYDLSKLPDGMKYDEKTGLITGKGKKGKPVNADLADGFSIKDGIVYQNGQPATLQRPNGELVMVTKEGPKPVGKTEGDMASTDPKKGGKGKNGGNTVHEEGPNNSNVPVGEPLAFLVHVYYDFDQAYIRDESEPALLKVLEMLNENKDFVVEIGSHTDARGSNTYNSRLSQRRAESVIRWLTKKGIERSRLVAKGYGETINVNNCKNNIPCSEQEHQMNRRTEFRVLGSKDKMEKGLSKPNENAKVDACQGCPF